MADAHHRFAALADDVERTMRMLGAWSDPAPPLVPFRRPFAMDAMPFEHWLQLVLVPRMREIAAGRAELPASSNLAGHAVREFDGRDDLTPLVDVLRAIDALSPDAPLFMSQPASRPAVGLGRRPGLAIALVVLVSAWAFVAVALATRLAPFLPFLTHPRAFQSFTGSAAPGVDFQPLRITVTALVDDADAIRPTDASLLVIRSMRTMTRGPTAPFDFTMNERPTEAAVLEWLADYGVDRHASAAHAAAAEALAVVATAAKARTVDALHVLPVGVHPGVHADELLRVGPQQSHWVELLLTAALVLAGGLPIAAAVVRLARSRR